MVELDSVPQKPLSKLKRGIEAKFRANIGQWNINNVERFDDEFGPDDSILAPPSEESLDLNMFTYMHQEILEEISMH